MNGFKITAVGQGANGKFRDLRFIAIADSAEDALQIVFGEERFLVDEGAHLLEDARKLGMRSRGVFRLPKSGFSDHSRVPQIWKIGQFARRLVRRPAEPSDV